MATNGGTLETVGLINRYRLDTVPGGNVPCFFAVHTAIAQVPILQCRT